ncbi:MAG: sigma-70 family RNA polymerase sigma factor [Acidobacteriota bacterium]
MSGPSAREITRILKDWTAGDASALERLTPLVLEELHRLARRYMVGEQNALTLETAVLVNEAFLRLIDVKRVDWRDRAHFFAMSATLMRQILVDFARTRRRQKRGGGAIRIPVQVLGDISREPPTDLVALDDALKSLARLDPRQSRVVELRYFGGLSVEETAAVLHVSQGTVHRDWRLARAWLFRELASAPDDSEMPCKRRPSGEGASE